MLKALKRLLDPADDRPALRGQERRQLQLAVATLLHEARRADYAEGDDESACAVEALVDLFALGREEARELLAQGRERASQERSFYAPLVTIKRDFGQPQRVRLVEHLWRVSFADGLLNQYEDHYVRKIAHLLYVSNTDSMLARNRAREAAAPARPA